LDGAEDYAVANTVAKHERKVTCGLFMLQQEEHDISFGGAEDYFTWYMYTAISVTAGA
jgi:hypothetical protein